jgi:hypothetical protein
MNAPASLRELAISHGWLKPVPLQEDSKLQCLTTRVVWQGVFFFCYDCNSCQPFGCSNSLAKGGSSHSEVTGASSGLLYWEQPQKKLAILAPQEIFLSGPYHHSPSPASLLLPTSTLPDSTWLLWAQSQDPVHSKNCILCLPPPSSLPSPLEHQTLNGSPLAWRQVE